MGVKLPLEVNPIMKHVGMGCNLRCGYCYYDKQDRSKRVMNFEILEETIHEVCRYNKGDVRFFWHGGEPLLIGIDFYEKIIELQEKFKRPDQMIINSIQTNGTLIDNKWVEFIKKNAFRVGISLDGPQKIHDYYRKYPDGEGSFEKVMKGIKLLKKEEIEFGVVSVVTDQSVKTPEKIFDFFISQHLTKTINFNPSWGIEAGNRISFEKSVQFSLYIDFLIKIFDLWLKNENDPYLKIYPLESIVRAFLGFPQKDCRFAGECEKSWVIDYNGDIFACCTYGYEDFSKFGNIKEELDSIFYSEPFRKYKGYLKEIRNRCSKCHWYKICKGGCPFHHYLGGGENILCPDMQRLFGHIQERLKSYQLLPKC